MCNKRKFRGEGKAKGEEIIDFLKGKTTTGLKGEQNRGV